MSDNISRPLGDGVFNVSYEVKVGSPVDARLQVDTKDALLDVNTWMIEGACTAFKGMLVFCHETKETYRLKKVPEWDDLSFSYTNPTVDDWEIIATQEWVEAQGYGQGSGSIDTSNLVTLDGEQTISGNKTFTGEVDFSGATVKGLAIDPADVDLAGYATEDWVKSQGYVTASYLDNILTFSTSGNEASAVNYSSDEALFTEDLYVTNPVGNFVTGENVNGLSLKEIITRLLKLEANV